VPKITVFLKGNSALLTESERAALKVGFLDRLEAASVVTFDRSNIVVELSSENLLEAEAFFKAGSGVDIADAHAIAAAIQYEGSVVTSDGGAPQHEIVYAVASHAAPSQTVAPTSAPTPLPTPLPVPKMFVLLKGDSASLTQPERAALKVGFLDRLEAESVVTFDRSNIVVELMSDHHPAFEIEAFFKAGSGVDIAEARAIAAAIQYKGSIVMSVVTPAGDATRHEIVYAVASHALPPQITVPTPSPTPTPSAAPLAVTSTPTPPPTCALASSSAAPDYCPCGYHDYGVRYSKPLGRITIVKTHQQCADRCSTFSGPEYAGGCKGYLTGMYTGVLWCRSYGSVDHTITCPFWAKPDHPGQFSGALDSFRPVTGQKNIGGNCCSNITFVDIASHL